MLAPDDTRLLDLMDRNMVAAYTSDTRATPGGEAIVDAGLAMFRTPLGSVGTNIAIVTGPTTVRALREATARMFGASGRPWSVWTREHADEALAAELRAAGFHEIHREPGMVLLPGVERPVALPAGVTVRPVVDVAGRAAYADIVARAFAVYGVPEESSAEHFGTMEGVAGPATQTFLAWKDGRAVAGATLYMAHEVGGIGWVGTLPEEFGRGHGAAVTWAVVEEGRRRGARFMNLQASPMGAPMYARMGFVTPTHYRWFLDLG